MKRIQLQLDEPTHEALRRRAFEEKRSLSAIIRNLLADAMKGERPRHRRSIKRSRHPTAPAPPGMPTGGRQIPPSPLL